jgi:hypothetical protein
MNSFSEEEIMTRISYDALLLQAHIAPNETIEVAQIAAQVFPSPEGDITTSSLLRAKRAACALVSAKQASAFPSKKDVQSIQSLASPGTQLAALMNIAVRQAIMSRFYDTIEQMVQ